MANTHSRVNIMVKEFWNLLNFDCKPNKGVTNQRQLMLFYEMLIRKLKKKKREKEDLIKYWRLNMLTA